MHTPVPLRPQGFFSAIRPAPLAQAPQPAHRVPSPAAKIMVSQLRAAGIDQEVVLRAMLAVPRQAFIDPAYAHRAYENIALPIGYQQTISQPWIVARMLSLALETQSAGTSNERCWLEIGTGCGYQAAVMAHCASQVYSIERIAHLHHAAQRHLAAIGLDAVHLLHNDGAAGWPSTTTPRLAFHAIVVAAAAITIAPAWLQQLVVGGRLIAPIETPSGQQQLTVIDRVSTHQWQRSTLDTVQFVPLQVGIV